MGVISITPSRLRSLITAIEKPAGEHGCWIYSGGVNGDGYPTGPGGVPVYRVVYEWLVGEIPDGHELDHLCRTRACVNPHHLEPVTHRENMLRSRRQGPWELRLYCRNGHALVGSNKRVWSDGKSRAPRVRCYLCHDGLRKDANHAA